MNDATIQKGYVNNCGRLNLRTGKNAHFNVLEETHWQDTTLTLFQVRGDARVVGGCGEYEMGEQVALLSACTHRPLGLGRACGSFPCTPDGLADIEQLIESRSVRFGTWD